MSTTARTPFTPQEAPPPPRGAHYHVCTCGNFITCYSLPDQCPTANRWQCPACEHRDRDRYFSRQESSTMPLSHEQRATLDRYATRILHDGPTRVVINAEADGVSPWHAKEWHGITPDVIFIRNDGWSLGAPARFEHIARALWARDWIGIIRRPSTTAEPIEGATDANLGQ